MLRAEIPAELERRGLPAGVCRLMRYLPLNPNDHEYGLLHWDFLVSLIRFDESHIEYRREESEDIVRHFRERVTLP